MSWHVLPSKRSPRVADDIAVDVFMQTRRLLVQWREDPERLAAACACYALQGYSDQSLLWDVASGDPDLGAKSITDDEALIFITVCLRRRNPRLLRARAEGLLMGLEALAQDASDAQRHDARVQSCIIECRQLELTERLAKLAAR